MLLFRQLTQAILETSSQDYKTYSKSTASSWVYLESNQTSMMEVFCENSVLNTFLTTLNNVLDVFRISSSVLYKNIYQKNFVKFIGKHL